MAGSPPGDVKRGLRMSRAVIVAFLVAVRLFAQDPTDAQNAFLDLEVFPLTQSIAGDCTWTFLSTQNGMTTVTLELDAGFAVSNVTSAGIPATFTRPGNQVVINLDHVYAQNESLMVGLHYSGSPTSGAGFGSFSFSTHSGATIVSTLSEPFYAYTWWPCKESTTDKFTAQTWYTVPDTMIATSNGVLQGTDVLTASRKRYRWASAYPIATYGVALTASNYQTRTDTYTHLGANMPVTFYCYPENFAGSQTGMDRIIPMLTVFSNLFGQYPFVNEKYGIVEFNWSGGMEHQTLTSQVDFSENLSAHELGHSWWGNSITCATWHDIGLNEGFATYSEALWDEFKTGGGTSSYFSRMNSNKPSSPGTTGSVYVVNPTSVNSIFNSTNVYQKGAWVLHQMRHVVGDVMFFQILRDYQSNFQHSSATWLDFTASASATYGQDLTWLVDQLVMRTGAPKYNLSWSNVTLGGQTYVAGNVRQIHTGLPYRFPVDIRLTIGGVPTTKIAWVDDVRDDFFFQTTGNVSAVSLDPSPWILRSSTTTGTYAPALTASSATVSHSGGSVTFTLAAGSGAANRPYVLAASATGVSPGFTFPDGKVVPLVVDSVTDLVLQQLNTPMFQNFSGNLSPTGQATATLVLPDLGPIPGPLTVYFAFATPTAPMFTSAPVAITITP
jgi:aminopeptidase N